MRIGKQNMKIFQFALLATTVLIPASSAWADPCPSTGYAQFCNEILEIKADGTIGMYTTNGNPTGFSISATPYDGNDDQLIGVVDNYAGFTVMSLNLTGTYPTGIFRFEGDGANAGGTGCLEGPVPAVFYGCNGGTNTADASGYMGFTSTNENVSYTIPSILNLNSGIVTFGTSGLQSGDTAWFSLEGPAGASGLSATANISTTTPTGTIPEPNAVWGLLVLGCLTTAINRVKNRSRQSQI